MTINMDLQRYSEDRACATPEGLREKMLRELLPLVEGIQVQRNRVIVATYVRPNVSAGGIIFTQKNADEDRWQGKVGLVLKRGPVAFDYEEVREGMDRLAEIDPQATVDDARPVLEKRLHIPQVGDWVMCRNSETWEFALRVEPGKAVSCRVVADDSILAVVTDPSAIY